MKLKELEKQKLQQKIFWQQVKLESNLLQV